jgi:hypothetical protein
MIQVTQAKKSQAIASDVDYKHVLHNYSYPPDSINVDLAKKAYALQSDVSTESFPSPLGKVRQDGVWYEPCRWDLPEASASSVRKHERIGKWSLGSLGMYVLRIDSTHVLLFSLLLFPSGKVTKLADLRGPSC